LFLGVRNLEIKRNYNAAHQKCEKIFLIKELAENPKSFNLNQRIIWTSEKDLFIVVLLLIKNNR